MASAPTQHNQHADGVRVRVAPSPTGDPHVGTAYQALFNYAFAQRHGGQFVLRIEDTDQARSTRTSETKILESLSWLGIPWHEGPDKEGPYGPYRQSERLDIYRIHVDQLVESGAAYRDFSTKEDLEAQRQRQAETKDFSMTKGEYRELDAKASAARAEGGDPHTIRLRVPLEGECVMTDLLRGEIRREWYLVDDQILMKSDGFPTYHLANVVDDHLMKISHVIRGEEWINSLPKHLLLYQAFGWDSPQFCHLPLLRNNDANKTKLSKRRNPTSIDYYRAAGFLPEALVNFLALMGTSQADGEEKLSLDGFVANFNLNDISLGGPVFDTDKLRWLNARYLREDLDDDALCDRLFSWALDRERVKAILPLARPRLETLGDWGFLTAHLFADAVPLEASELVLKGAETQELIGVFQFAIWRLEALERFNAESIQTALRGLADQLELKMRDFTRPFYVAMSGRAASTPLFETMEIVGPDLTRSRLRAAIEALGGVSGKATKKLEKRYAGMQ